MKSKIVRKRLFAVALAAAMMSSVADYSCVMEVRAEESVEEQNLTVEETVEIDPEILEQLPDNDELFAGHVEQVLYGNDDASIYANYGEDKFEDLNLNLNTYTVEVDGETIELTLKEFNILKTLIEKYPQVITRENLLDSIWGYDYYGDTRIVDAHIKNLRKKIKLQYIKTVKGIGYTLEKSI